MLTALVVAQLAASCLVAESSQLVVVVTEGWTASSGELFTFHRAAGTSPWQSDLARVPVFIGKKGLGVGKGALRLALSGPQKQEGDARSPAGVFRLGAAFGTQIKDLKTVLPQDPTTWVCVDDPQSKHYNERLLAPSVIVDWKHEEQLASYQRAVVIHHNDERTPGAGSCVFLHDGIGSTPGCSAGASWLIDTLIQWLRPTECPILVQLPRKDYAALGKSRSWPALPARQQLEQTGQCPNTIY